MSKVPGLPGKELEGEELQKVVGRLKELWLATDQMCSKRLKAAIPQ